MEGDIRNCTYSVGACYFNPLPPHGGRQITLHVKNCSRLFQSTPSAWRETMLRLRWLVICIFQSTPSAWRETRHALQGCVQLCISIHSLRMEGDFITLRTISPPVISIHSLRMEGDCTWYVPHPYIWISIHSLRMEGDRYITITFFLGNHFNPLPPHGGRLTHNRYFLICLHFNPLPPHGGRLIIMSYWDNTKNFNPLPPHGGRLLPA